MRTNCEIWAILTSFLSLSTISDGGKAGGSAIGSGVACAGPGRRRDIGRVKRSENEGDRAVRRLAPEMSARDVDCSRGGGFSPQGQRGHRSSSRCYCGSFGDARNLLGDDLGDDVDLVSARLIRIGASEFCVHYVSLTQPCSRKIRGQLRGPCKKFGDGF